MTDAPPMPTDSALAEVAEALATFPDERERAFETAATELCLRTDPQLFENIVEDPKWDVTVRYAALFCLGTRYRRDNDVTRLINLLARHAPSFSAYGTFHHLRAMACAANGSFDAALMSAERAFDRLPDHPGVLHMFASIMVSAAERYPELRTDDRLDRAAAFLEQAFALEPGYAKFHLTRGRLLALRGDFEQARQEIMQGIDREDSSSSNYPIRMIEYQASLGRIAISDETARLGGRLQDLSAELRREVTAATAEIQIMKESLERSTTQAQTRYLELLGFFAAMIALIVSSAQILSSVELQDAMRIVPILGGTLLVGFAALAVLLGRGWRSAAVLSILGLALLLTPELLF
jgi:tetratricopeptide (TPR) repeat protein